MKLEKFTGRSAAMRVGDIVYVSGQAAVDGDGSLVGADDFDVQAGQAFANVERVLLANGTTMNRVIKVTLFLTSMNDAPKMLALRRQWFAPPYPAESMVEVSALHVPGAKIVIDVVAARAGPQAAF
jgi:enamine deaminase RidA (YjgF/YER057c/UK114 family)